MNKAHEKNPSYGILKTKRNMFVVNHFAGAVDYTIDGWLEKNRDLLSEDAINCLATSANPIVLAMAASLREALGAKKKRTVGGEE